MNSELHPSIYYLNSDIGPETATDVLKWVVSENSKQTSKGITLVITSNGGECASMFAIIDALLGSGRKVLTVATGKIASAGLYIFMAGHARWLSRTCEVMSHQFSAHNYGKYSELIERQKSHELLSEKLTIYYMRRTGQTIQTVESVLLKDTNTFLSPVECLTYGICSKVIDDLSEVFSLAGKKVIVK